LCHIEYYHLEKCLSGILIVAKNKNILIKLRELLCSVDNNTPQIVLTYRCIFSGNVGEIGEFVNLDTPNEDYPIIHMKVINVIPCRSSKNYLIIQSCPINNLI
jgi:hypothetical protein